MKASLALFALLGCFIGATFADLPGYLPPTQEPCYPQTRTKVVQRVQTSRVVQAVTVTQTQTRREQRVQTQRIDVAQTRQRVVQSQIVVPVVRNVQRTVAVTRTQVQNVPFQPPPQTRVFTSTAVRVQTRVDNQFVTRTQTSVRQVFVTRTQVNTQFVQRTNVQTQVQTREFRQQDVQRFVTQTQVATRTQQIPTPAFTSQVQREVVQTRQQQQFVTPRPFTRTQVAQREVVRTQVQNVVRTQQAVATRENVNTQVVQVTRTQVNTITSTQFRNQVVERTQVVERVVTRTQVIPQTVVRTSVFNQVNNQVVTRTQRRQVVDTQTVRGRDDVRERIVTSVVNRVRTVQNNVRGNDATVVQTITMPCQQTGYNYNRPNNAANFLG